MIATGVPNPASAFQQCTETERDDHRLDPVVIADLGEGPPQDVEVAPSSAGFAALAAGETEPSRLRDALEQMDDTSRTPEDFNALDTEFHVRVGEASKNRLVGQFMQALRHAVRRQAIEAIAGLGDWQDTAGLREDHQRIYEAIAARDPAGATAAVDGHIRHVYPGLPRQPR